MSINLLKQQKSKVKKIAIDLRRQGMSYSEIKNEILKTEPGVNIPIATMSLWLKSIKLSNYKLKRLEEKRIGAIKNSAKNKTVATLKAIEDIKNKSAENIRKISKKEFWLMGIILYWRERFLNHNKSDLQKGVRFTSSDPSLVKFFIKWLDDIGNLKKEEIGYDIFVKKHRHNTKEKVLNYWLNEIGLDKNYFVQNTNIYYMKNYQRKKNTKQSTRQSKRNSRFGLFRIRVRASSMMARQISGWVHGIKRELSI